MPPEIRDLDDWRKATPRRAIEPSSILICACVFFTLLYLSLIVFFALPSQGGLLSGSRSYGLLAADIATTGTFSSTYRPPLYPLLLAGLMLVTSEWSEAAVWLQGAVAVGVGVAAVWLTISISKSTLAGCLAAALYASHALFHIEMLTERETALFSLLNMAFLALWLFGHPSRKRHLCMAVVTALLYLTRPTGMLFVPLLCTLILIDLRAEALSVTIRRVALCVGVVVLLVLPWQIHIAHKVGELRLSASTTGGVNLLKGNNPDLERFFPMVDVDLYEPFINEYAAQRGVSGPKSDEVFKEFAVSYILSEPLRAFGRSIAKGFLLFSPLPIPLGKGQLRRVNGEIAVHDFSWRSPWLLLFAALHALLVFGGVAACVRSGQDYLAKRLLLGVCLVSGLFILAHAATFPETRFRLPLDPLLIVVAASGYAGLFGAARCKVFEVGAGAQDSAWGRGGSGSRTP